MKKTLFIAAAVLFVTTLTSCSPYLIDRIFDTVAEYEKIDQKKWSNQIKEYECEWVEKTKEEAVEIWNNYPAKDTPDQAAYKKLDFYEHTTENGKEYYTKWKDCATEKWPKINYYEDLPWSKIYSTYAASKDFELNAEAPHIFTDSVKIYAAKNDSSLTKFVFDSNIEKGCRVYKYGWLVHENSRHLFEEPAEGNPDGYDVQYAIVYKK